MSQVERAKYFPSKKDRWLGWLAWTPVVVTPALAGVFPPETPEERTATLLILAATIVPVAAFMGWIWFRTGYWVTDTHLRAVSGPLRATIPLESIRRVRPTRSPLASLALSLDRLEIRYGRAGIVFVSPKERDEFVALLKARCPNAVFERL